jgi:hypothetical protein
MKEGLLGGTLRLSSRSELEEVLHAGLDLSRARLDVRLVDERGEPVERTAAPPDADGLRHLAERLRGQRVRAVIESMTGARFVHDRLEELGWEPGRPRAARPSGDRRSPGGAKSTRASS